MRATIPTALSACAAARLLDDVDPSCNLVNLVVIQMIENAAFGSNESTLSITNQSRDFPRPWLAASNLIGDVAI